MEVTASSVRVMASDGGYCQLCASYGFGINTDIGQDKCSNDIYGH